MSASTNAAVAFVGAASTSVCMLIAVVFAVLKITGTIAWSWFWVLSPLYVAVGIYILLIVTAGLFVRYLTKEVW